MAFRYGNSSQFIAGQPQCGAFSAHPTIHYIFLYYMPIMSGFAIVVNVTVIALLLSNGRKLLDQSQHVYVLGCAVTNACVAIGCNIPAWIDTLVMPCVYKGVAFCFVYNLFNFAGGYQLMLNVCLVCYDRWRLVRLGVAYRHTEEVRRAKWLLIGSNVFSVAIFVVPELVVPLWTGVMYDWKFLNCHASQGQIIPQINLDIGRFLGWFMIAAPWAIVTLFTVMTLWQMYVMRKKAPSATSQVSDPRKMLRASLVMFGMVVVLLLTFGPLGLGLFLLEYTPNIISWYQVQCLLYIQFTSPALDPFAFAATLPKLRERARATFMYRKLASLSTPKASKLTGTNKFLNPLIAWKSHSANNVFVKQNNAT